MRTRKFRLGREPPPGGLTWRRASSRSQIPTPRTERDADRQARDADRGAQSADQAAQDADRGAQSADQAAQDADRAMTALYQAHYRPLVQLAALLVADLATAENIVQEAFAAAHESWCALPGTSTDAALGYLRRSVVHRSRSAVRGSRSAVPGSRPAVPSAVVSALQALPVRQREVMVLRYFAELSETEIASATGMSPTAVRNHTALAMSSLRGGLHRAGY